MDFLDYILGCSNTILFANATAADRAYKLLISMIDITLEANAVAYNKLDEKTVK